MLNVSQLTRSYGDFVAVDNVSFSIKKGEIIGLLGHNGAGKTTIMKMISGYLEADHGEVTLDDIALSSHPKLLQKHLGYLPENLPVYPEMTVAEYLDYAADLKGLDANDKRDEIKRVIKATDIEAKLLAPIQTLSRGYKQRVGVAQAILGKPKLLILDEPTNGLDPKQTQHMRALIKDIAQQATVILSTHIMQEVNALCNRVLIIKAGKLLVDEKLEALKNSKHIMVKTDCQDSKVFEAISGVSEVSKVDDTSWQLEVTKHEFINSISADISQSLINQGFKLFALYPEKRDLESLFQQLNEQNVVSEEVANAA
ncbi:ABC transporter ATP-binding protein [Thalassotalea ganghwensis]